VQSAQAISAAYYFDLVARDYSLADGAIEVVIEGVPCSAFIEPSQNRELIFCDRSDGLQGRKHGADSGKFRRDLQEHSGGAFSFVELARGPFLAVVIKIPNAFTDFNLWTGKRKATPSLVIRACAARLRDFRAHPPRSQPLNNKL
jgi:hypothetical protein